MGHLPKVVPAGSGGARFGVEAGRLAEPGVGGPGGEEQEAKGLRAPLPPPAAPGNPFPEDSPPTRALCDCEASFKA